MTGERILVVDDAPDILEALVITLNDASFETLGAPDGRSALRAFYEFQPQLVVLDLVMPMMNGIEVCRQVRAMSDVPVVFLSGVEDTDQKIEALRAGGDDFIVKGGSFTELIARIEANLRRAVSSPPPDYRPVRGRFPRYQFRDERSGGERCSRRPDTYRVPAPHRAYKSHRHTGAAYRSS